MVFIDRQQLVQILYDSLKEPSRVLVNQGVVDVETYPGGVQVHTKNNDTFTGEILVGADGIHSTVRKAIYNIAEREKPGHLSKKELDGEFKYQWLPQDMR